jgi:hypothetical protein
MCCAVAAYSMQQQLLPVLEKSYFPLAEAQKKWKMVFSHMAGG